MAGSFENAAWSVLIVDDDEDDCALLTQAFKTFGAPRIKSARDGAEALEALKKCRDSALPRLVLLDINLPKVRGTEVLKAIKTSPRTRRIPVVMLTGSASQRDIDECYDSGANGYVVKPSEWGAIERAVATLAGFWLGLNQPPATTPKA